MRRRSSLRAAFHIPLYIHPADAARRLDFRDCFNRNVARRLDQLSPDRRPRVLLKGPRYLRQRRAYG